MGNTIALGNTSLLLLGPFCASERAQHIHRHIGGLVQDYNNSIANALEVTAVLRQATDMSLFIPVAQVQCFRTRFIPSPMYGVLHVLLLLPYNPSYDDDNEGEEGTQWPH